MKSSHLFFTSLALLLATLNTQRSTAFAQGSLTPSGPPAPTMLTLNQIVGPLITTYGTITNSNPWANFSS